MHKLIIFIFLLLFSFSNKIIAQQSGYSHEIGIVGGPVYLRGDYGERGDSKTNQNNDGIGFGIVHYMNFAYDTDCRCYTPETFFNEHFKLRSDLSYSKSKLKHYGQWVSPSRTKLFNEQLRAMEGSSTIINLGMQLEFTPLSVRDFTASLTSFAPYISLGAGFSSISTKASSSLGPLNIPATTPIKYIDATQNGSGTAFSITTGAGVRYKVAPLSDLVVEGRLQYYFSDWVDGLNPNPAVYTENKANDWLIWFNIGYIMYIN